MVNHTKGEKGALRPPEPCCQGAFLRRRAGGERLSAMAGQARALRSARLVLPAPAAPTCPRGGGGGGAAGSRRDKVDSRKFPRDRGWGGEGRAIPGSAALRRAPSPHGAEQGAAAALEAGAGAERPAGGAEPPGLPVAGGRHRGGAQ